MIRAFVVDDEPRAVRRLSRMLQETGRVTLYPVRAVEPDTLAGNGRVP